MLPENFANPLFAAQPGSDVRFGVYPQSAAGADRTAISWRVLQNTGADLLLLSEYILDCRRYHRTFDPVTWRDSDLRGWLHEVFFKAAFSAPEQALVQTVRCSGNGEGSPDTDDRVFLLSMAEVQAFTDAGDGTPGAVRRRTMGTAFAQAPKADGCRLYVYDKGVAQDYVFENGVKLGCSWWWTRTQPQTRADSAARAAFVGARSNIKTYGRVDLPYYGVRPAVKLRLQG